MVDAAIARPSADPYGFPSQTFAPEEGDEPLDPQRTVGHQDISPKATTDLARDLAANYHRPFGEVGNVAFPQLIEEFVHGNRGRVEELSPADAGALLYTIQEFQTHQAFDNPKSFDYKDRAEWLEDLENNYQYKRLKNKGAVKAEQYRRLMKSNRSMLEFRDKDKTALEQLEFATVSQAFNQEALAYYDTHAGQAQAAVRGYVFDPLTELVPALWNLAGGGTTNAVAKTLEIMSDEKDREGWGELGEAAKYIFNPTPPTKQFKGFNAFISPWGDIPIMGTGERQDARELDPGYVSTQRNIGLGYQYSDPKTFNEILAQGGFPEPTTPVNRAIRIAAFNAAILLLTKASSIAITSAARAKYLKIAQTEGQEQASLWLFNQSFKHRSAALKKDYRAMVEFGEQAAGMIGFRPETLAMIGFTSGMVIAEEDRYFREHPGFGMMLAMGMGISFPLLPGIAKKVIQRTSRATPVGSIDSLDPSKNISAKSMFETLAILNAPKNKWQIKSLLDEYLPSVDAIRMLDARTGTARAASVADQANFTAMHRAIHTAPPELRAELLNKMQKAFNIIHSLDPKGQKAIFIGMEAMSQNVIANSILARYKNGGTLLHKGLGFFMDWDKLLSAEQALRSKSNKAAMKALGEAFLRHPGEEHMNARNIIQGLQDQLAKAEMSRDRAGAKIVGNMRKALREDRPKFTEQIIIDNTPPHLKDFVGTLRSSYKREPSNKTGIEFRTIIKAEDTAYKNKLLSDLGDTTQTFESAGVFKELHNMLVELTEELHIDLKTIDPKAPAPKYKTTLKRYLKKKKLEADVSTIERAGVLDEFNAKRRKAWEDLGDSTIPEPPKYTNSDIPKLIRQAQYSEGFGELSISKNGVLLDGYELFQMARTQLGGDIVNPAFTAEELMTIRSAVGKRANQYGNSRDYAKADTYGRMKSGLDRAIDKTPVRDEVRTFIDGWRKRSDAFRRNYGGKTLRIVDGSENLANTYVVETLLDHIKKDPAAAKADFEAIFGRNPQAYTRAMEIVMDRANRNISDAVIKGGLEQLATEITIPKPSIIQNVFSKSDSAAQIDLKTHWRPLYDLMIKRMKNIEDLGAAKKTIKEKVAAKLEDTEAAYHLKAEELRKTLARQHKNLHGLIEDGLVKGVRLDATAADQIYIRLMEASGDGGSPAYIQEIINSPLLQDAAKSAGADLSLFIEAIVARGAAKQMGITLPGGSKGAIEDTGYVIDQMSPPHLRNFWDNNHKVLEGVMNPEVFERMRNTIEFVILAKGQEGKPQGELHPLPAYTFTTTALISRAWNVSKGIVSPFFPLMETAPRSAMAAQRYFMAYFFTDPWAANWLHQMSKDPGRYLAPSKMRAFKSNLHQWLANIDKFTDIDERGINIEPFLKDAGIEYKQEDRWKETREERRERLKKINPQHFIDEKLFGKKPIAPGGVGVGLVEALQKYFGE